MIFEIRERINKFAFWKAPSSPVQTTTWKRRFQKIHACSAFVKRGRLRLRFCDCLVFLPLNHETANEDSLAFTEKLKLAFAHLNQRVELRWGFKGKQGKTKRNKYKNTGMIWVYIVSKNKHFVSFHQFFETVCFNNVTV